MKTYLKVKETISSSIDMQSMFFLGKAINYK